jgi:hypothetical protein
MKSLKKNSRKLRLDTVGVAGSIPVEPTISGPLKSII